MTWLKDLLVAMFAHQYAWFLYRSKRSWFSADFNHDFLTYQYFAIMHGVIFALLIIIPYAAFVAQYPAPKFMYVLLLIALTLPSALTLQVYKKESSTIKRMGKEILALAEGAPYSSLALGLSSVGLLFVLLITLVIVASPPN